MANKKLKKHERAEAECLLKVCVDLQNMLWDRSCDLEAILGCAVNTCNSLEDETIESIIERNEEI